MIVHGSKRGLVVAVLSLSSFVTTSAHAAIAEHFAKTIAFLEVPDSPCIFF